VWLVFLLLLALPIGCGAREPGEETVELWGLGREGEVAAELVPEFEQEHPGVRA